MLHNRMDQLEQARSESQCSAEQAWLEGENVWLVHRDGFAAGRQLRETEDGELLPEGRVRVKLDYNGEVVEVDEDDVEKANPPSFDRLEDLAQLRYLNESSVLHTLRQRYVNNLIQTYAGPSTLAKTSISTLKRSGTCSRNAKLMIYHPIYTQLA